MTLLPQQTVQTITNHNCCAISFVAVTTAVLMVTINIVVATIKIVMVTIHIVAVTTEIVFSTILFCLGCNNKTNC